MGLWTHQTALDWILNHLTQRLAQFVQLRFHLSPYAQYSLSQRSTMEFRNTRFDYLRITNCIVVLLRTRSGWFFMSSDGCRHGFQVPKNPNRLNGDPTIYVTADYLHLEADTPHQLRTGAGLAQTTPSGLLCSPNFLSH